MSDVFIEPNSLEEKSYCKKHNIILSRFDNGIVLVGINCYKEFSAFTEMNFEFQEGAFGNKIGAVHLLEHLLHKKLFEYSSINNINLGAYTTYFTVVLTLEGISNPKIKDFGIWPVLEKTKETLFNAPIMSNKNEKEMQSEIQVIKAEIKEKENNYNFEAAKNFSKFMFAKNNPLHDISAIAGDEKSLEKIKIKDLVKVHEKITSYTDLIISFYSLGKLTIQKQIYSYCENLFLRLPNRKKNVFKVDKSILEEINPDAKPGVFRHYPSKISKDIAVYYFSWIIDLDTYSRAYFAVNMLSIIISRVLHKYSRTKGWGYTDYSSFKNLYLKKQIFSIVVISKKGNQSPTKADIRKIFELTKKEIPDFILQERKRQLATPIDVYDRFSWIKGGIGEFGAIINIDKIRKTKISLSEKDYYSIFDKITSVEPIVVVTG